MGVQEELQRLKELRLKIITAMDKAVETINVENYSFGDGNGNQSVRRRSPKELMDLLKEVDNKIMILESQTRSGLMTFQTNRYSQ